MATPPSSTPPSSNQISFLAAVSIGIGGMVGAGIFSILGVVAQAAGNAMWLAFAIGGVVALALHLARTQNSARPSLQLAGLFISSSRASAMACSQAGSNLFMWAGYIISIGALCHGVRELRRDLHHRSSFAAVARIDRGRLGGGADDRQCVRGQGDGARRDLHCRREGRHPGAFRGDGPVLREVGEPFPRAVAGGAIRAVRGGCSVHRLRRLRSRDQRGRQHAQPADDAAARALYGGADRHRHLSRGGDHGERKPHQRGDRERPRLCARGAAKPFLGEFGFRLIAIAAAFLNSLRHQCHRSSAQRMSAS